MQDEDVKFRLYLEEQGFDTGKMGLPMALNVDGGEQIETVRRESEGTFVGDKGDGEGHARDVPVVKVAKKGKGFLERLTGVAP
jgi:formyltetrahydrofolate synthetase